MAAAGVLLASLWLVRGRAPGEVGVPADEVADSGATADRFRATPPDEPEASEEAASVEPEPDAPAAPGETESPDPLTAGDERSDVVLVLDSGNALGGRILAAGLGAVAGAELLIFGEPEQEEHRAVADHDGRFHVAGLGPGPFRVWAWDVDDDGELRALTSIADVPAGLLDLELRLAPPGAVELTLRGRRRKGIRRIDLLDLGGWPAEVRPDPFDASWRPGTRVRSTDGGLVLEDLEPGERWVVVTEAGGESRSGRARILVRGGETRRDEIVLGPACQLSVTLVQDGEPVLGSIAIRAEDGFVMRLGPGVDAEGAGEPTRRAWLPSGRYRVTGERERLRAEAEVMLSRGPFRELALELE